jgi:hypothetical protein
MLLFVYLLISEQGVLRQYTSVAWCQLQFIGKTEYVTDSLSVNSIKHVVN